MIPISTDQTVRSTPWVTILLIVANCVIFALTSRLAPHDRQVRDLVSSLMLDPASPRLLQFISYQFLHGGGMHLLGNMLFLYIFGRPLEDRIGALAYLAFYLASGVFAGVVFCLLEDAPVIGASGSIAGISGAFLALFPESRIRFLYWWFYVGTFEVSGKLVMLFYIGMNVFLYTFSRTGGVAYSAHLGGYLFGFTVAMTLLLVRLLPRNKSDLLTTISHSRRRQAFINSQREADEAIAASRDRELTPDEQVSHRLLKQIAERSAAHDPAGAAGLYLDLIRHDPKALLGRTAQLEVANQLMAEGRHADAALAYQRFLDNNNPDPQRHEVQLLLALVLVRYLASDDPEGKRARPLLEEALKRLGTDHERQLAQQLLAELAQRQ
jgi:membrane associated rhomboid family serine protease